MAAKLLHVSLVLDAGDQSGSSQCYRTGLEAFLFLSNSVRTAISISSTSGIPFFSIFFALLLSVTEAHLLLGYETSFVKQKKLVRLTLLRGLKPALGMLSAGEIAVTPIKINDIKLKSMVRQ